MVKVKSSSSLCSPPPSWLVSCQRANLPSSSLEVALCPSICMDISGLSWQTNESQLKDAFSSFGEVTEAFIVMDKESGQSKGFGFVSFASSSHADAAVKTMNGRDLNGKTLRVNFAVDKLRGVGGFGGGGGYGGYGGSDGGGGRYGGRGGGGAGGGYGGYSDGGSTGGYGAGFYQ